MALLRLLVLLLALTSTSTSVQAQLSAPVSENEHVSVDGNKFLANHATLDLSTAGALREEEPQQGKTCPQNVELRWSTEVSSSIYATPIITDLYSDGRKDIIVPSFVHYLEVLEADNGAQAVGWPAFHRSTTHSSPLMYDIDLDGVQDIMVVTYNGEVMFFKDTGEQLPVGLTTPRLQVKKNWFKGLSDDPNIRDPTSFGGDADGSDALHEQPPAPFGGGGGGGGGGKRGPGGGQGGAPRPVTEQVARQLKEYRQKMLDYRDKYSDAALRQLLRETHEVNPTFYGLLMNQLREEGLLDKDGHVHLPRTPKAATGGSGATTTGGADGADGTQHQGRRLMQVVRDRSGTDEGNRPGRVRAGSLQLGTQGVLWAGGSNSRHSDLTSAEDVGGGEGNRRRRLLSEGDGVPDAQVAGVEFGPEGRLSDEAANSFEVFDEQQGQQEGGGQQAFDSNDPQAARDFFEGQAVRTGADVIEGGDDAQEGEVQTDLALALRERGFDQLSAERAARTRKRFEELVALKKQGLSTATAQALADSLAAARGEAAKLLPEDQQLLPKNQQAGGEGGAQGSPDLASQLDEAAQAWGAGLHGTQLGDALFREGDEAEYHSALSAEERKELGAHQEYDELGERYEVDIPRELEEDEEGRLKGEDDQTHEQRLQAMGELLSSIDTSSMEGDFHDAYAGDYGALSQVRDQALRRWWQDEEFRQEGHLHSEDHVYVDAHVLATPNLADIDGDGHEELVLAISYFYDQEYYDQPEHRHELGEGLDITKYVASGVVVFDLRTRVVKWTQHLDLSTDTTSFRAYAYATPTLADINRDGLLEVVVGTSMGFLYVLDARNGNPLPGWPIQMGEVQGQALVLDINSDGHLEVVAGDTRGNVAAFKATGEEVWSRHVKSLVAQGPTAGDINNDGEVEVVFGTASGHVYALSGATGADVKGFPFRTRGRVHAPVLITRLLDGPSQHLIVPSFDGYLYLIDGITACADTVDLGETSYSMVLADDLDGNGRLDLLVTTMNGNVYAFETPSPYHPLKTWPAQAPSPNGMVARHDLVGIYASAASRRPRDIAGDKLAVQVHVLDKRGVFAPNGTMVVGQGGPYNISVLLKGVGVKEMAQGSQPVIGVADTVKAPGVYTLEVPCPRTRSSATVLLEMVDASGLVLRDEFSLSFHFHFHKLLKWLVAGPLALMVLGLVVVLRVVALERSDDLVVGLGLTVGSGAGLGGSSLVSSHGAHPHHGAHAHHGLPGPPGLPTTNQVGDPRHQA